LEGPRFQRTSQRTPSSLFAHHLLGLFVSPKTQEDGLTKLVVAGPLGKLDLGDQQEFSNFSCLVRSFLSGFFFW
jgi:hypothetical protein